MPTPTDSDKLRMVANWFAKHDASKRAKPSPDVEAELRQIADKLDSLCEQLAAYWEVQGEQTP